jgi:type IV fimbrial biogenesis protein FimT
MRKQSGFTLIELLVVIAILGTMMAIAVPNILSWLPTYRVTAASRDVYSNYQRAKLTAVKRNINCGVTFISTGYTVYIDEDSDFIPDGGEEIVVQVTWSDYKNLSVGAITIPNNGSGNPTVAFRPNGLPIAASMPYGGTVPLNIGSNSRNVILSQAGSISIQ